MKARVFVSFKTTVLDPQGLTIRNASIGIGGNAADNLLREFLFKRLTKLPEYNNEKP